VAKAAPAEQLRLLDLQALDSKLNQLQRQAAGLRADPAISDLQAQMAQAETQLVGAETELGDVERELARAENDVETVVARLQRDQQRLDSGTGSPKDLTALQSEVVSLTRRQSDLEDVELEVMERVESARGRRDGARDQAEQLRNTLDGLLAGRDAELADVAQQEQSVRTERAGLAATFDTSLLAVYDKTLARRGVGAARLFHGRSEGSGMELSPGDLADIRKAAEEDIVFCPDSGCILVRSAEWDS
jgi:predicted  nucleic acid-binding Zn-ribbon protein